MRYIVETRTGNSWENTWTDDGVPCVFESRSAARAALDELMEELPDYAERDYRIVSDRTQHTGVEAWPVCWEIIDGRDCFEECAPDSPDLHCWGVYMRHVDGHAVHMADCPTKEIANTIVRALLLVL
jgi:hypothetical protein